MAHPSTPMPSPRRERLAALLAASAAGLFVLAVLLAVEPALSSGPTRWAALALLTAVALAAGVALPASRRFFDLAHGAERRDAGVEAILAALAEPAALLTDDGAILAAN